MGSQPLSARGPQKIQNGVEKESRSTIFQLFWLFSTPFWTFCAPGPKGPGNPFSNSICNFRPEGPNDPRSGQTFRNLSGFPNFFVQESRRTRVSRIFRNFVPNFAPKFSPFRASFCGRRRPEKNHQKSPPFLNAKFPGKHEKSIHKILLESRQSKI